MFGNSQVSRLKQYFHRILDNISSGLRNEALTHVSYANEKDKAVKSNERLEFLGDAVLSLAVGLDLLKKYPDMSEGDLTRKRAYLVSGNYLAALAGKLGLGDCLFLGKGEEATGGRQRPSVLAGALEAVIGACFLEYGWEEARKFVYALFEGSEIAEVPVDPKTRLQELVQSRPGLSLEYVVMSVPVLLTALDMMWVVLLITKKFRVEWVQVKEKQKKTPLPMHYLPTDFLRIKTSFPVTESGFKIFSGWLASTYTMLFPTR